MKTFLFFVLSPLLLVNGESKALNQQPQQIHLAFGEKLNDLVVSWVTQDEVEETLVKYGESIFNIDNIVKGENTIFQDPGPLKRKQTIHLVTLKDLKFNTKYFYKVGSARYGWSSVFWFKTVPEGDDWVVRTVVVGDMGNFNARALPNMQEDTANGMFDVAIHVGDIAYDMYLDNGQRADYFMMQIEPIATQIPYMTCPGNHEKFFNYTHYKSRFMMPGNRDGMYYSWNAGRVHFIAISTEHYYDIDNFGSSMVKNQYEWLLKDLKDATTKENRNKRPWIIIYGHRSMYCSNWVDTVVYDECLYGKTRIGVTINDTLSYELETLLISYGVDLVIWAHEHSYERTWPINNLKIFNGTLEKPYVNPRAPVHIISGSGGNHEGQDIFAAIQPEFSAFRAIDQGYSRMSIHNKTHLYLEQVSVDIFKVIDSFWLVKDKHGPYQYDEL